MNKNPMFCPCRRCGNLKRKILGWYKRSIDRPILMIGENPNYGGGI